MVAGTDDDVVLALEAADAPADEPPPIVLVLRTVEVRVWSERSVPRAMVVKTDVKTVMDGEVAEEAFPLEAEFDAAGDVADDAPLDDWLFAAGEVVLDWKEDRN